ncbi:uncharacterized protein LOC111678625 [Lucilia cuprina]|uniref:uncharacterized protein LOC111678625 n=1 Tax=Lucilia cuprina TaxID=7375 RepID=UPI001F065179|nr:uncharacterized protein LOC111678625 [Lucilia cuprina]
MRKTLVLLCLALACLSHTQAAVYRRGDKISENFKQLDLAPEEIDPDVAPLSHHQQQQQQQQIETVDETTDEILNVNENEILDEAGDNEIIDESANEIPQSVATVAPVVATTVAPVTVSAAAPAETAAATPVKGEPEPTGLAKYCKCNENHCDCCRNFNLPLIPVKGPGCARMTYLGNEKMSISLKYGDLTLASRTVSSKRARPICVGLPGGYSQFCGRVYGLSKANENFKACLGFELRADDEVEAALRVSCFKFGPEGLRVAEAEPLPVDTNKEEDDDDDDIFGFGAGDDEEEEDDYNEDDEEEEEEADDDADTDSDAEYADDDAEDDAPADADYGGFSLAGLLDELDDDEEEESKPSDTPVVAPADASTRTAVDSVQSKDDKGTAAATAPAAEAMETVAPVAAMTDLATTAPESMPDTTAKTKKSKKARKNKKKKAADSEGDFAYEILNGLLDFFN